MTHPFLECLPQAIVLSYNSNEGHKANLHINLEYGEEPHHIAEAIFKCFARALDAATTIDPRLGDAVPTTKGTLSQ